MVVPGWHYISTLRNLFLGRWGHGETTLKLKIVFNPWSAPCRWRERAHMQNNQMYVCLLQQHTPGLCPPQERVSYLLPVRSPWTRGSAPNPCSQESHVFRRAPEMPLQRTSMTDFLFQLPAYELKLGDCWPLTLWFGLFALMEVDHWWHAAMLQWIIPWSEDFKN